MATPLGSTSGSRSLGARPSTHPHTPAHRRVGATAVAAGAIDVLCVVVFVAIGRSVHGHPATASGLLTTAWPFLVGTAVGWVASRAWGRPAGLVPSGVAVWASTLGLGMLLREAANQGVDPIFVGVAGAFLALFLLGWRLAATAVRLARRR